MTVKRSTCELNKYIVCVINLTRSVKALNLTVEWRDGKEKKTVKEE